MNPSFLVSLCVFFNIPLGNLETPQKFWLWAGKCVACGVHRKGMSGLFCANFASGRLCWTACRQVWCGKCYTPHPKNRFYRYEATDEGGFDWRPEDEQARHMHARDGDHLLTPFQCDLCLFRNIQGRDPSAHDPKDELLLCCIRRANLDAVWGGESHTVQATLRAMRQLVTQLALVGVDPKLPALGPHPVSDSCGIRVAIGMLLKSLSPGRHSAIYQQFKTIRKLRAGYANVFMASLQGTQSLRTVGGDRAKHYLTQSPTQSLWFERFSQGCLRRMGQDVRKDWAITLPAMHALQQLLLEEWEAATSLEAHDEIATCGAFSLVAFCGSLRGNETFLVDLAGLRKYLRDLQEESFVIIPLLGRYKGEQHTRYHLIPMAVTADSGLRLREWLNRLVQVREDQGKVGGPAFQDRQGAILSSRLVEGQLMDRLQLIKETQAGVIPADVDCFEHFGISRSFRRGATSTARTRGVKDKHVELINRWRKFEDARGRQPSLPMVEHYSDVQQLVPEMVKFSQAL